MRAYVGDRVVIRHYRSLGNYRGREGHVQRVEKRPYGFLYTIAFPPYGKTRTMGNGAFTVLRSREMGRVAKVIQETFAVANA